uniref:Uncharacterized protein n=1 Tax=Rhizophora mucronata TaxID=61149 RepID=A0A2P2QYU9_RHIMU
MAHLHFWCMSYSLVPPIWVKLIGTIKIAHICTQSPDNSIYMFFGARNDKKIK